MNAKHLFIGRTIAVALFATGLAVPQAAISQTSVNQAAFYCEHRNEETKKAVFSDIITFTRSFHAGWTAGDKPKDDRPYSTYRPEFAKFLAEELYDSRRGINTRCDDFDSVAEAEQDREKYRMMRENGGFAKASIATGWRPTSLAAPVTASKKPITPAAPKQNEHILVRDPDVPVVVKPVVKAAPKPVAKAKPAAKPVPKKKTGCKPGDSKRGKVCGAIQR